MSQFSTSRRNLLLSTGALAIGAASVATAASETEKSAEVTSPAETPVSELENPLGLSIHHATVGVASIATMRKFYHDVLGFRVGLFRNRPQFDHQQMHIPGFRLDMIEQKGSVRPTPTMGNDKQGWLHIDLSAANPGAIYEKLKAAGAQVTQGRMEGEKLMSMKVADPEGNLVEITVP